MALPLGAHAPIGLMPRRLTPKVPVNRVVPE